MPLSYYPRIGEVLVCDYGAHTIEPEMFKTRPVVVVSRRLRNRPGLVGIVPLSTTEPDRMEGYHCFIELETPLPPPFDSPIMWAKCDMYSVVALRRLDRFKAPRSRQGGGRTWVAGELTGEQCEAVRQAVLIGLGFN